MNKCRIHFASRPFERRFRVFLKECHQNFTLFLPTATVSRNIIYIHQRHAFLPTKKAPSPIHRICTLICIFINVKLIVNIHTKNLRSGQSIGSDSDSDSENEGGVVDGESNVDLSGYSRQERDRAHSVFNHCTTAVRTVL